MLLTGPNHHQALSYATVGQSIRLPRAQTAFDFTVGQYLVSDKNARILSDARHCPMVTSKSVSSYDGAWQWIGTLIRIRTRNLSVPNLVSLPRLLLLLRGSSVFGFKLQNAQEHMQKPCSKSIARSNTRCKPKPNNS